jgi:hypothetical protein
MKACNLRRSGGGCVHWEVVSGDDSPGLSQLCCAMSAFAQEARGDRQEQTTLAQINGSHLLIQYLE